MKDKSEDPIQPNDPEEMKKSAKYSFLCKVFQKFGLSATEKKQIIKQMIEDHKRKKYEEAIP